MSEPKVLTIVIAQGPATQEDWDRASQRTFIEFLVYWPLVIHKTYSDGHIESTSNPVRLYRPIHLGKLGKHGS